MTTTTTAPAFDTVRSEAFAEKVLGIVSGATTALMISLGHRTGLFDAMERTGTATPAQIAAEAGLAERYVREWLGAMVTSGVVEYQAEAGLYILPAEHAAWLTRSAAPNNLATVCQWVPVMGAVEDEVLAAFEHGKGVPYEKYERFHEVMAEDSEQTTVMALQQHILPLVPGLTERLEQGIDVLDIGCGLGKALMQMATLFPNSRFVGYELPEPASQAQQIAQQRGLSNVKFIAKDAAAMDDDAAFDLITTFDAIHDQAKPDVVLRNIARALRPNGVYLMQEIGASSHLQNNIDNPLATFIYTVSTIHCMSVSLACGGPGLGAAWGRELAEQMLGEAGFTSVERHKLDHDPVNEYFIVRH